MNKHVKYLNVDNLFFFIFIFLLKFSTLVFILIHER